MRYYCRRQLMAGQKFLLQDVSRKLAETRILLGRVPYFGLQGAVEPQRNGVLGILLEPSRLPSSRAVTRALPCSGKWMPVVTTVVISCLMVGRVVLGSRSCVSPFEKFHWEPRRNQNTVTINGQMTRCLQTLRALHAIVERGVVLR